MHPHVRAGHCDPSGEAGATVTLAALAPVPDPAPGTGRVVVGELPGAPPAMQELAELAELAELDALVTGGEAVSVVSAVGVRGVGKTQLAAALARRAVADPTWSLVAWVSGESPDVLVTGLAEVADRVGVADPDGDTDTSARRLREHLTQRQHPALLVIDNAVDADGLRRWLPAAGPTRVVITSTEQAMTSLGATVEVGSFRRAQSLAYLAARTGLDDPDGADRVAEQLGDLPLALAQAASAIVLRARTYPRYLELLATVDLDTALVRRGGDPYPRGAAEAVLLTVTGLEAGPDAATVTRFLEMVAVLAPTGVDRDLLTQLLARRRRPFSRKHRRDGGVERVEGVVETLVGASLLSWTQTGGAAVVMHRLIARVLRDRARSRGTLTGVLADVTARLDELLVVPEGRWEQREFLDHLAGHALPLWHHHRDEHCRATLNPEQAAAAVRFGAHAVLYLDRTANLTRAIALGWELPTPQPSSATTTPTP